MTMASTFGAMATSMGLSQKEAANMSMELTGLAADMASFYNVSTDVAQTSLQGVFTGETEALKKFGVVMTQTNLEAFAAKQGKVYKTMSEAEKVMTRYEYVLNATQSAQGDFARTSDGTANSLRTFSESCKELGAAFGEVLIPIITPVIQALTKVVQWVSQLPAPIRNVIVVLALVVAAIGPIILIIGSLMSAFGHIVTAAPTVVKAITSIAGAITGLELSLAPAIGVIALFVAAIIAAAALGTVIGKHWDEICAAAERLGNGIKEAYQKVVSANNEILNKITGFISEVIDEFRQLPGKIKQAIKDMIQQVKDEFSNLVRNAKQSGQDFIDGFVNGIKQRVQKVVDAVKDIAKTVEEYLGFSCPDKGPLSKYESWMPDFMEGLAKGIEQNKSVVTRAINDLSKDMVLPLDASASMNMAISGSNDSYAAGMVGGFTMNVSVDHINDLNDLLRIQQQAQQRLRMGAV